MYRVGITCNNVRSFRIERKKNWCQKTEVFLGWNINILYIMYKFRYFLYVRLRRKIFSLKIHNHYTWTRGFSFYFMVNVNDLLIYTSTFSLVCTSLKHTSFGVLRLLSLNSYRLIFLSVTSTYTSEVHHLYS